MESTYGDRNHRERLETIHELGEIFARAHAEKGNVLIPAFAVGALAGLLYWFAQNYDAWELSRWHIFLDSPMASKVMHVYERHTELFDEQARAVWRKTPLPFTVAEPAYQRKRRRLDGDQPLPKAARSSSPAAAWPMAAASSTTSSTTSAAQCACRVSSVTRRRARSGGGWSTGRAGCASMAGLPGERAAAHHRRLVRARGPAGIARSGTASSKARRRWLLVHGEDKAREALAGEIHERYGREVFLARPGRFIDA
jgi:metallo-beta-lactamase family protein